MSHAFGSICATHQKQMQPATCPECPSDHGYTYVECGPDCPDHQPEN